jgi:hypothetical protein
MRQSGAPRSFQASVLKQRPPAEIPSAQVVWPNGVLASTAVGIAVDLLTGWTRQRGRLIYLMYDGDTGELRPHPRLDYLGRTACRHYGPSPTGDPLFRSVQPDGKSALRPA